MKNRDYICPEERDLSLMFAGSGYAPKPVGFYKASRYRLWSS